eukprot:391216-Rhodomonas_salina.1
MWRIERNRLRLLRGSLSFNLFICSAHTCTVWRLSDVCSRQVVRTLRAFGFTKVNPSDPDR